MDEQIKLSEDSDPVKDVTPVYTNEKGEKVTLAQSELTTDCLQSTADNRLKEIFSLKELNAKELCLNCKFWNPTLNRLLIKDESRIPINGECRAHAPSAWIQDGSFPKIGPFQWCGEYKAVDNPK